MIEPLRRCALALLAAGLPLSYAVSAGAQEFIDEEYVVDDPALAAELDDDDDDASAVIIANSDGMERCAETFRSFDPTTGTYVTYAGETLPCPYLE